jgi:NADPH-dependent 2,4-dienoyl-CoA reductase/sulfur reductase-like enzyme
MQTNLGGVYAAGDCIETTHLVTGRPAYIPLGTTANKMGRVAGANAAGARERFAGVAGTCIFGVFGLGVGITGLSVAQSRREGFSPVAARVEARGRAQYFGGRPTAVELVADRNTGRMLGGAVIGEQDVAGRINVVAAALQNRMLVEDFEALRKYVLAKPQRTQRKAEHRGHGESASAAGLLFERVQKEKRRARPPAVKH